MLSKEVIFEIKMQVNTKGYFLNNMIQAICIEVQSQGQSQCISNKISYNVTLVVSLASVYFLVASN